jgi:hypothetical protein
MDNSDTHREAVSRTYQGVDGYTPIALYLGNEDWNIGLELRAGSHHSALEMEYFLERTFPRLERLCATDAKVLWRDDSAFDSARLCSLPRRPSASAGRDSDDLLTSSPSGTPRGQNKNAWVAKAEAAGAFVVTREGKRVGLLDLIVERSWAKHKRSLRLVVQVTERTIDKRGQHLLLPEVELQGSRTSLEVRMAEVIELYKDHGTQEQFHSELKTDPDLERLPSGKFDTNDVLLHLAAFAYNCLRLLGQLGLTGEIAPIRHPAKRCRIKTVLQEIMYRTAKLVAHARRLTLNFGRNVADHVKVFIAPRARLSRAASL